MLCGEVKLRHTMSNTSQMSLSDPRASTPDKRASRTSGVSQPPAKRMSASYEVMPPLNSEEKSGEDRLSVVKPKGKAAEAAQRHGEC
jgi:hypothetical protein